jgi:hypothetical protein
MIKGNNLMDLAFFKCTATLLYIVLKKGDIVITLGMIMLVILVNV